MWSLSLKTYSNLPFTVATHVTYHNGIVPTKTVKLMLYTLDLPTRASLFHQYLFRYAKAIILEKWLLYREKMCYHLLICLEMRRFLTQLLHAIAVARRPQSKVYLYVFAQADNQCKVYMLPSNL